YMGLPKNDVKAFSHLNKMISQAKKEKNYQQLTRAYTDAVYHSKSHKIEYADSAIDASIISKNKYIIANSYTLKGSIYYFSYRRYQKALDQYLQAYEYAKSVEDLYLQNKIKYHIAVVKSYLGFSEAQGLFKECADYFHSGIKRSTHPNDVYNHKKGYLNSLHQLAILYRNSGNFPKSDSLIVLGLNETSSSKDFDIERAYFYKCQGISLYNKKNYEEANEYLNKALPEIKKANDFTW